MIYLIFLLSILLHELGHIAIGRIFGYKLKNIHFLPFGIYIEFKEKEMIKKQSLINIVIYLFGPIVNFFICIIFLKVKTSISEIIIYMNLILGVFNLLPIHPLDGSKIIKEVLYILIGNKRGNIYSHNLSKCCLCIFTFINACFLVKFHNISIIFAILYLWYVNQKEEESLNKLLIAYNTIENHIFEK